MPTPCTGEVPCVSENTELERKPRFLPSRVASEERLRDFSKPVVRDGQRCERGQLPTLRGLLSGLNKATPENHAAVKPHMHRLLGTNRFQ